MSIKIYDKSGSTPQEVLLAGTSPVDQILNSSSKNAIANKTVYNALADKIDKTVQDLIYYYTKSDVYNKTETRQLLSTISTMDIRVVNSLPVSDISTTTIYFLKQSGSNTYDEYVYVDNAWVKIGDTSMDLSQYMKTADFNIAIADYYTKSEIDYKISNIAIDNLTDIQDVNVNNLTDGQTLVWDDTNSEWINGAGGKTYTAGDGININSNDEISVNTDSSSIVIGNNKEFRVADTYKTTFIGTTAQWEALSAADKAKYSLVSLTDDSNGTDVTDTVTDGDMRPVTSNAVADKLGGVGTKYTGTWVGTGTNPVLLASVDVPSAGTYIVEVCTMTGSAGSPALSIYKDYISTAYLGTEVTRKIENGMQWHVIATVTVTGPSTIACVYSGASNITWASRIDCTGMWATKIST